MVYAIIVARGVLVALSAEDEYGSYVAFGLSMLFGVQALVNLAVSMSMLPTKGLTLPFISYGGSSLLVNAAAMGILLNISRRRDAEKAPQRAVDLPEASEFLALGSSFGADGEADGVA